MPKHNAVDYPSVNVPNNLVCTPSEMLDNAAMGIPIKSQLVDEKLFDDGDTSTSVEIANIHRRGYSVNDAWNEFCDSQNKAAQYRRRYNNYLSKLSNG